MGRVVCFVTPPVTLLEYALDYLLFGGGDAGATALCRTHNDVV